MPTINAIDSNIPIEITKGGTNAISMPNANGVVYFDGTMLNTTTVGAATEVLTSNGSGQAPSFQAAPATSMFFQVVAADPGAPINSQVWYNSTTNLFKGYQNGGTVTFTVT